MKSLKLRNESGRKAVRLAQIQAGQRRRRVGVFATLLIVVMLFLVRPLFTTMSPIATASAQAAEPDAEALIQQAWDRTKEAGAYAFDADITQIQRPLASVLNVGKPTKRDNLYLEGVTNIDDQTLEMTLWTQGGTVQDKDSGAQIRIEDDVAFARQAGQSWQEIDNFTGLFAPDNDFMTYLVAAVNVQDQGSEIRAGIEFKRITFDIDGLAYAYHMRDQIQADMLRRGELATGSEIELPKMYSGMTGSGELWIDTDGLPLRQLLQLDFAPDGDQQVSAEVSVNFKDFSPLPPAPEVDTPVAAALSHLTPILPGTAAPSEIIAATNQLARNSVPVLIGFALIGLFLIMLVYARRSRKVLGALQLTLIWSMLFAPLLRSVNAEQISYRQQDRIAASDARSQESSMMSTLKSWQGQEGTAVAPGTVTDILNDTGTDSDNDGYTDVEESFLGTNPLTNPALNNRLPSIAPTQETPTEPLPANYCTDSDGDGLTDYVEALIGTAYDTTGSADTDGDGINDGQEVFGFTAFGENWVTDPLEADTNRDGISDGQEWTINAVNGIPADSDNDQVPDLFDIDNDGDQVPDKYDLSPNTFVSKTFDGDNPFSLILNGLETDKITYVEFQLRPTNGEHLQYTYNAFDWPDDTQGNIQDGNSSKEDVRLVPMLEMIMPDAASNLLPLDLLGNYSIMVQDLPGENQAVYVPLNLQVENRGSRAVAFNGKMIYNGVTDWDVAHQVRLVWIVQAQNDVCAVFDDAGLCESYSSFDTPQVIHTYEDSWELTGLNVRENHWSDVAIVYEDWDVDEDPTDDSAIWMLGHGLDLTFMAGGVVTGTNGTRLWDVAEIKDRFDYTTNSGVDIEQRWNISNTLSVETASYSHLDEALVTTVQTTTLNLLNSEFTPHWSSSDPISPTLIFARQDQYRSFNLDETAAATVSWGVTAENANELTLNIPQTAVPIEIASTLSWAPYLYDDLESQWKSYPIEQYWEYLAENIAADMAAEYTDPEVAAGATILAQIYYMALTNGLHNIVQVGDQRLQQAYFNEDRPLGASFALGSRVATIFIVKFLIERQNLEATVMLRLLFAQIRDAKKFAGANPVGVTKNALGRGLTTILSKLKAFGLTGGMAKFAVFLVVAAIAVGIGFLIATAFGESTGGPARIAVAVVAGAVTYYLGVIGPIMQIRALAGAYQSAAYGGLSASGAYIKAALSAESISKGAKIAAGIGLVIAIVISWVMFAYIIGNSDIAPGSVEFNTLLAQTIAATILAVIQFALSLTIVGAIIVAILGIIDLLLFIVGLEFSINGWLTEQLGKFIYHFELTIDSDIDTGEPDLTLVNPNGGMVEGMMMAATMPITTSIVHNDPDDFWGWRILPYLPAYYTASNIRSTTFKYSLSTEEAPFNSSRDNIRSQWDAVTVDHQYAAWNMYRATNFVEPTTNLTLEAGINGPLSLYLNNSYSLPGVECWTIYQPFIPPYYFPLCLDKTIAGKGSSDVGSYLILDVLPDTLDEFVALDWGNNLEFPVQADYDNDKLTTRDLNGNDPNDFEWDTDFDGLSDSYEIQRRESGTLFDPNSIDSDLDGLSDYDEVRFGTDPGFQDTDRDGLKDSEEVWHFDTNTNTWSGGWMFTVIYTNTNNVPNQTLNIKIFSDPLDGDVDEDGLSDGVEKALHELDPEAYPFHPSSFNESPIALYLDFDDEDRFVAPNQSVVISATVRNNLSDPLYAKGELSLELPNGLGQVALLEEFNIFQGQTSSIVTTTNVTVNSSGPLSVSAGSFTRLHDGDLSWSYAWLPNQTDTAAPALGDRVAFPSIAANPGPASIPYKYAVGALEYPDNMEYFSANVLGNGVAVARTASTQLGGPTNIGFNNNPDIYHTIGKIGNSQTDIVCNDLGKCAEAYVGVKWSECTNVYFDYMHVYKEDDAGDVGEYGLYHNYASGASRVRFWGWVDGDNGDDLIIDKTRLMCPGDTISAYEEDDWPNGDDNLGSHEPDITGPHGPTSHRYKNGDDVEVYYTVQAAADHYGFLRLLDSNLTYDSGISKNLSFIPNSSATGPRTFMRNPAVATSGNRWLAGYEEYFGVGQLYVMSVNNNGTDNNASRLDTDSTFWGYRDHNLDLTWNGNHFLAVWERNSTNSNHDIKMALVDLNGNVVSRKNVDLATSNEREPAVAYSAALNQTLLVYVSGSKVVGRFIEGSNVGTRFDIGTTIGNELVVAEPKVAYDQTNNLWMVSWLGAAQSGPTTVVLKNRTIPLAPGTLNGGATALAPVQTVTLSQGDIHDFACANPDVAVDPNFRQITNCAIVSSGRRSGSSSMKLSTILLESTPPWIGGGGGLTNTADELLTVDADDPISTITSFAHGETVPITDTFTFGGEATDLTATAENGIVLVEVNIDGSGWQPATGTNSWSYSWDVPPTDGTHSIQVRATDLVGHVETPQPAISVTLDRSGPQPTIDTPPDFVTASQDENGRYHLHFSGIVNDTDSNVASVEVVIAPNGNGWQTTGLDGNVWFVDYILPEFDENGDRINNPTGNFTLSARATDALGNVTDSGAYATMPFKMDTTPPEAALIDYGPSRGVISDTITLTGVITDPGSITSGIQQLEIDFVPAGQISNTWQIAALANSGPGVDMTTWSYPVPSGLEGNYLINLRGTDGQGNQGSEDSWFSDWQGEIDTLAPRVSMTATLIHNGKAAKTILEATITDRSLTEVGLDFPCDVQRSDRGYETISFSNTLESGQDRLTSLHLSCQLDGHITDPIELHVFDIFGHETVDAVTADGLTLPLLAGSVLAPAHESAITDISAPITIDGGAYGINGLKTITLTINGSFHEAISIAAAPVVTDTTWQMNWTPPGEGVFDLVTTVEDWTGSVQTDPYPVTVFVDTTPPDLTLNATTLTAVYRISAGRVELTGTVSDTLGLEDVTVAIDGGPALAADLDEPNWRYVWPLPSDPDGVTYNVVVTASDMGNETTIASTVTVDVVAPQGMTVTPGYTDGGAPVPINAGDTVRDPAATGLTTAWTAATDGGGIAEYRVGWTNSPTPTLSALTSYPDASTLHATPVSEATLWFGHTAVIDTVGNESIETIGPIVVDAPNTPDYINPSDGLGGVYRGWMESGCSLVGADYEVARYAPDGSALNSVQQFYTSWDATHLRLAWTGADWRVDGDLFIYLDTISGGATAAYNPYSGAGAAITMPDKGSGQLGADYLIFVEDGENANLLSWNGSAWVQTQTLSAPNFLFDPNSGIEKTDLYIPFTMLGSPSSLKMVALASDEEALRLWAAMPDHNPLNSEKAVNPAAYTTLDLPFALTQHYEWANVGAAGVCPATGQFENADMHFELIAEPAGVSVGFLQHDLAGLIVPATALDADLDGNPDAALPLDLDPLPVGQGLVVSYTLNYENRGTAAATGVVADITAAGGLASLSNNTLPLGTIAAGSSGSVSFTAVVDSGLDGESAEIQVEVADSVHAPFEWLWQQHDIDSVGPTDVEITSPVTYIGANVSTLRGVVTDVSGVPEITLRVNNSTTQTCVDSKPYDGEWSCLFDAGGATDGTTFQFDAKGTDEWNNMGAYGPAVTLVVDTSAPSIALSATSLAALNDGRLTRNEIPLSGTVTDDRSAAGAEVCVLAAGETDPTCVRVPVSPSGQATADWLSDVPIPADADGASYTLTFYGIDSAGNRTLTPITKVVTADFSGPNIQVTTQPTLASQFSTVVALAGTISDGSGVASLTLQITAPDNGDLVADEFTSVALGNGANWSHSLTFSREGNYQFGLIAVDNRGNQTSLGTFVTQVLNAGVNVPPTVVTGGPYEVNEGETLTWAGIVDDINIGQTLTYAWDMDDNGTFETADTLTPVFDATTINGPTQRTVWLQVNDGEFTTTVIN